MGSFASKDMTPQEQMRAYKREVDRAVRELDRERTKLERQNDKLAADIKKAVKNNQIAVVKIMAKDYVRCKRHVTKFLQLRTWLQGIGIQLQVRFPQLWRLLPASIPAILLLSLQTMKSVDAMAGAMKNATRAMVRMNARLNIPQLQSIMRTFGIESSKMEDTMEIMGDSMDDAFAVDDEETEENELVSQVMAELHIDMDSKFAAAPVGTTPVTATAAPTRTAAAIGGPSSGPKPPAGGAGDDGPSGGSAAPSAGGAGATGAGDLASRLAALRAGGDK
jgi:charged multivesicular body protein 2A